MKKILFLFVVALFLSLVSVGSVSAQNMTIYNAQCFKDGSAEITVQSYNSEDKIYTEDINFSADFLTWYGAVEKSFSLNGEWKDGQKFVRAGTDRTKEKVTFTTDEALFKDIGDYRINVGYGVDKNKSYGNSSFDFFCDGMIFSCKLININIEQCKNIGNKFEAVLDIEGINQSELSSINLYNDIDYMVKAKNKYKDIKGEFSETGSLPKGFEMEYKDGKYYLSYDFKDNIVYSLVAKFRKLDECKDSEKYPNISMYSYKECDLFEDSIKEENNSGKDITLKPAKEQDKKIIEKEVVKEIIIEEEDNNKNLIIGILVAIILLLVISIIIILKKRKVNKWWIK